MPLDCRMDNLFLPTLTRVNCSPKLDFWSQTQVKIENSLQMKQKPDNFSKKPIGLNTDRLYTNVGSLIRQIGLRNTYLRTFHSH